MDWEVFWGKRNKTKAIAIFHGHGLYLQTAEEGGN